MNMTKGLCLRPFTEKRHRHEMNIRPDFYNRHLATRCPLLCPAADKYVEREMIFGSYTTKVLVADTATGTFVKPTEFVPAFQFEYIFNDFYRTNAEAVFWPY